MPNSPSFNEELITAFVRLIANYTGIEIRDRERDSLRDKIFLRIKTLKLDNPNNYYQLLNSSTQDSHEEWKRLLVLITNVESFFFRDTDQFALLRDRILPELIQRKQNKKTLRICSAGCSSGEEPYSLAILLKELLQNLEEWNLTILGIDINQEALQKAKTGIYRPWSFRRVDVEIIKKYFRVTNNQYHLNPSIMEMVNFQNLNLLKDLSKQPNFTLNEFDLILCRNVFIYFDSSAIEKVLNQFYTALAPLGYLITGHAELYGQNLNQFQANVFPESVVYQRVDGDGADTARLPIPDEANDLSVKNLSWELNQGDLVSDLEKSNVKMQQAALNLLKQLPPGTQIPKLGNLTAAELITQLETALNSINQEST